MKALMKPALVLGMAGALALSAMTPSQARIRPWAAAGIGLAAGAFIASAAAANRAYHGGYYGYYGPRYGYGPYYATPTYTYAAPAYTYSDPAFAYTYPAPGYSAYNYGGQHWDLNYGYNSNTISSFRERQLRGHDY